MPTPYPLIGAVMLVVGGATACSTPATLPPQAALVAQVRAAEAAFAKTMADRDFAAFGSFIAPDAVFINNGKPLRGKAEILAFWKTFYDSPAAPFSWTPELAEVAARGDMGYTEGPVTLANGSAYARFYSTWRRDPAGQWQVVFDNGYRVCDCAKQ